MISTNRELTLHGGVSVLASRTAQGQAAIEETESGIANLDQRPGGGAVVAIALLSAVFSIGMILGAGIVFLLVVIFTK